MGKTNEKKFYLGVDRKQTTPTKEEIPLNEEILKQTNKKIATKEDAYQHLVTNPEETGILYGETGILMRRTHIGNKKPTAYYKKFLIYA